MAEQILPEGYILVENNRWRYDHPLTPMLYYMLEVIKDTATEIWFGTLYRRGFDDGSGGRAPSILRFTPEQQSATEAHRVLDNITFDYLAAASQLALYYTDLKYDWEVQNGID